MPEEKPVDISTKVISELEKLAETLEATTDISEREFEARQFPIRYNKEIREYEWDEKELRKFYEDPENASRTIYCQKINVDLTDDWGMFGYTPGFIFIEEKNYAGSRTINDQSSVLGLSIKTDPATGIGIMSHYDYFPRSKYKHRIIRQTEYPKLFEIMSDIFIKKMFKKQAEQTRLQLDQGKS